MQFRKLGVAVATAAVATFSALCAGQAQAAVSLYDVTFSVPTVAAGGTMTPPLTVTGAFTISLDTAMSYIDETSGITLTSLNIALGSALSFDYFSMGDVLIVGGLTDGADGSPAGSGTDDDFILNIQDFTTASSVGGFFYVQKSPAGAGIPDHSQPIVVTVTPITAGVPEPATWALMLLGVGGVGAAMRSRRGSALLARA